MYIVSYRSSLWTTCDAFFFQAIHEFIKPVQIGYPGTKFSLESDCIINVSPDLPKNLDTYKSYLQLVIMDGSSLRERAADTWTQCKKLGLDAKFLK